MGKVIAAWITLTGNVVSGQRSATFLYCTGVKGSVKGELYSHKDSDLDTRNQGLYPESHV